MSNIDIRAFNKIEKMCIAAIKVYNYGKRGEEKEHATNLSILSKSDLDGLPTNNSITERDLSRFDICPYKTKKAVKIDKGFLSAILSEREAQWNEVQNE